MEVIIALLLFVGLIVCWLLLPGSTTTAHTAPELVSTEGTTGHSAASQPA